MDGEQNIKLFNTDANDIALPSESLNDDSEDSSLISESIDSAILGDKVKTIIIPEDTEINPNNYIFDFTNLESINVMQLNSLKSLVSKSGDIQLYLYNDKKGLMAFGMGDKYALERVVPLIKEHVFDNAIHIYKDFVAGGKLEEVSTRDITKMRLNL